MLILLIMDTFIKQFIIYGSKNARSLLSVSPDEENTLWSGWLIRDTMAKQDFHRASRLLCRNGW